MRSGRALAPSLQSGPLSPCTLLASPPRHALTPPSPHLDPTSYALLSTRQNAVSFNQPLSFDISNLENGAMRDTFSVRVPWTPSLESDRLRACRLRRRAPRPPPDPHLAPASYALLSTRQKTYKFNQPLSLDTSKVTNMGNMFRVRSARALAPGLESGLPPCLPLVPPPPHRTPSCPAFDSAERDDVQPAAELRHVQRHGHDRDVLRALRACPGRPLPSAGPHFAPHRMPSFRLGSTRRCSTSRWPSTRPRSRT